MKQAQRMQLQLEDLRFFGHFGVYSTEQKWLTELRVCITVSFRMNGQAPYSLQDTIDYQTVYGMVANEFSAPADLLENLAIRVADRLILAFPQIEDIRLQISKKPQLGGPAGPVVLEYTWEPG